MRNDSGSVDGVAKLTWTSVPARDRTSASARPAPTLSASGWTWQITLTDRAAASTAAAPCASTRLSRRVISVVVSIAVTGVLVVLPDPVISQVAALLPKDRSLFSYHTVRLRVSCRSGAGPDPRHVGVGGAGASQQLLHLLRGVGHLVAARTTASG